MLSHKKVQLSLVGAGPGDPELITLKAIRTLQRADAVLYDALVSEQLLKYTPLGIPKIFVGKRKGFHSKTQDEINRMIVEYAYNYGHVVRLKGGDPFIFGRGYEELEYASAFGVDTTVVPGLSSATSLSALLKIPLTVRGINEGFRVITACNSHGNLSASFNQAVQSGETLIILMGMHKLKEIESAFQSNDKSDIPFVIIQNGSLPDEHTVFGFTGELSKAVKQQKPHTPGIIIVGNVVGMHPHFSFQLSDKHKIYYN